MGTASTSGGTVNVAVVGAGGICNSVHMPSLKLMPDVNVVAICDLIPERAEKTAAKWGIPHHYTLMREMFANEKIDAVMNLVEPASPLNGIHNPRHQGPAGKNRKRLAREPARPVS